MCLLANAKRTSRFALRNTLVGEAAESCNNDNLKPVKFFKYLLQLCDIDLNNIEIKSKTKEQLDTFCHLYKKN